VRASRRCAGFDVPAFSFDDAGRGRFAVVTARSEARGECNVDNPGDFFKTRPILGQRNDFAGRAGGAIVRGMHRPPRLVVAFALGLALAVPARAGLYKCARSDGSVTYQEEACPAGTELRDLERDPATVSVVPFRVPPGTETRTSPREKPVKAATERKSRRDTERRGNAAERKFLMPGIGEGEVVARVGRPDMSTGAGRKVVRWTYLPVPEDPGTITTLTFELGRLVEVERKVIRTP
jgi:hypothetical protein